MIELELIMNFRAKLGLKAKEKQSKEVSLRYTTLKCQLICQFQNRGMSKAT